MKKLLLFVGVVLTAIGSAANAQDVNVSLDARFGYHQDFANKTGRFCGDGLFLDINGRIGQNFSYSMNHRIASAEGDVLLGFDATNWLTLTYEFENFSVTAGKDALLVGSFEYDAYDLDSYADMNSMFWNSIDPWQWGVSGAWYPTESHSVLLQVSNSPFSFGAENLFGYNVAWRGEVGCWESYWSANLWQYAKGRFVKAFNFGNRFRFGDFSFDFEYMTRTPGDLDRIADDFTILLAPAYELGEMWRIFGKIGYETSSTAFEYTYTPDNVFYGAGAEFFPLKENKDVRLHAIWASNIFDGNHILNIGLTWKFDVADTIRRIVK